MLASRATLFVVFAIFSFASRGSALPSSSYALSTLELDDDAEIGEHRRLTSNRTLAQI
jgi:hypothetical protein